MTIFHENYFWRFNQFAFLFLWVLLLYRNLNSPDATGQILILIFLLSQLLQVHLLARRMAVQTDFTSAQTTVLILLLGYSWWLPVIRKKNNKEMPH